MLLSIGVLRRVIILTTEVCVGDEMRCRKQHHSLIIDFAGARSAGSEGHQAYIPVAGQRGFGVQLAFSGEEGERLGTGLGDIGFPFVLHSGGRLHLDGSGITHP